MLLPDAGGDFDRDFGGDVVGFIVRRAFDAGVGGGGGSSFVAAGLPTHFLPGLSRADMREDVPSSSESLSDGSLLIAARCLTSSSTALCRLFFAFAPSLSGEPYIHERDPWLVPFSALPLLPVEEIGGFMWRNSSVA